MPGESAQARAVKGEGADARLAKGESADARLVKGASAPRVLCAGIIVLDDLCVSKVPVKSAFLVAENHQQSENMRLKPCHSCAVPRHVLTGVRAGPTISSIVA